MNQKGQNSDPL